MGSFSAYGRSAVIAGLVVVGSVLVAQAEPRAPAGIDLPEQQAPPSNQWLQDADTDADRFRKLETYLGGFSSAMLEVGKRYRHFHQAIADDNLELAAYQWEKIGGAIKVGLMKRPARTANAEALFLDEVWPAMEASLEEGVVETVRTRFGVVREACMTCHAAEGVPFVNDQPLFRELVFE